MHSFFEAYTCIRMHLYACGTHTHAMVLINLHPIALFTHTHTHTHTHTNAHVDSTALCSEGGVMH